MISKVKNPILIKYLAGVTPLHWAAEHGYLNEVPKELLSYKPAMLSVMRDRHDFGFCVWSPLHLAARSGHLDQIPKEMLTIGNLVVKNGLGNTSLHLAAECGHLDQVPEELFTADLVPACGNKTRGTKNPIMTKDSSGWTFLHNAAWYGHLGQLPERFLRAGNMLVAGRGGESPLHTAATYGFLGQVPREVVQDNLLLEADFGWTVLHSAKEHSSLDSLLGIPMPDDAKYIVGEAWWEKNLKAIENLKAVKTELTQDPDNSGLDMF